MAPSKKTKTEEITTPAKPVLVARVVAPMQSVGRAGKSTFNDALLYWLGTAGVHFGALDLDSEHHTLSDRYEGFVKLEPDGEADMDLPLFSLDDPEAIRKLLGGIVAQATEGVLPPVVVLDFPAQATESLLSDFEQFRALDVLADHNIRLTIPLFLSDDPAAAASLGKIVGAFGDRADYLFVRNPKVRKSTQIEGKRVIREMLDAGVPVIDMPGLTDETMAREIPAAEHAAGRRLPLNEVSKRLSPIARMEVESFLWQIGYQLEDAADLIVPNAGAIQKRIDRTKFRKPSTPAPNARKKEMTNLD